MVKQLGKGKARTPSKKEKLFRIKEAQNSEKLASTYIYPISIASLCLFFIGLYLYLYFQTKS